MSKNKLTKFAENRAAWNVIEPGDAFFENSKGNWNTFFKNDKPLVLELACGRGEYTVGLAREYSDRNFVGVDIKGARLWKGSQIALAEELDNAAFLRILINHIDQHFAENEVDELWVTFPDPFPKKSDRRRRLTHPRFLELYKQLLKPEGLFHLKTDNTSLFDHSLEYLQEFGCNDLEHTYNLYESDYQEVHKGIKTYYEALWTAKGMDIKYLRCKFN